MQKKKKKVSILPVFCFFSVLSVGIRMVLKSPLVLSCFDVHFWFVHVFLFVCLFFGLLVFDSDWLFSLSI